MARLTKVRLQQIIGVKADGIFGPLSMAALTKRFTNRRAPAITDADFKAAADRLGVPVNTIKGSRKVEAPRGSFDDAGRPTILFERHKFRNNSLPVGKFNTIAPDLSGAPYGPGGYGSLAGQWDKLLRACALDPEAAFRACSWGAFQVMGENAVALGYPSAFDMALGLVASEAAHLDTFVRYVETNNLTDELRACRPNDPVSCQPFVAAYNGATYRRFRYDEKFAAAIA